MGWRRAFTVLGAGPSPGEPSRGPGRSRRRRRSRQRRTWPQRLALTAGCLSVVGLSAGAAGLTYAYRKYERLPRIALTGVLDVEDESGRPENFLVVGVDSASGLDEDDPVRVGRDDTYRSDTIMIVRIDPRSEQAALLSLPRDLWIPIPGTGSSQRINSTIQRGGPELLIRTIDENFDIPIHHYVEVDFAAFRDLVDAVGGVPIYVPRPARDEESGLYLPESGCVTLEPAEALAFVRSRHYEELIDGEWVEDRRSDLGRIQRQQDFIRRAIRRAFEQGGRSFTKLDRLIDIALDGVAVDAELTANDILRLADDFRSFDPDDLLAYSVPTEAGFAGEAAILRLVEDEAEPILDIFRDPEDRSRAEGGEAGDAGEDDDRAAGTGADQGDGEEAVPPGRDVPPSSIRLRVVNGSGRSGEATAASQELAAVGFEVTGVGEEDMFDDDPTVVQYPPGQRDEAAAVARWLRSGADLEEVAGSQDLVVITGADWTGVRPEPRTEPSPSPGRSPDPSSEATTATTTGLSATTSSLATTTTSAPRDDRSAGASGTTPDPAAAEC